MSLCRHLSLVGLSMLAPLAAQATVLTFTSTFGTGGLGAYGDRVSTSPQGGTTYGEGDGWTPNVVLDFVTLSNAGPATLWNSGYASLSGALGHGSFNVPSRIDFKPDAGYVVTLRGFDIATWSSGSYQTNIRIWDDSTSFDSPLFSFNQSLSPNIVYRPLATPIAGTGTLRLYVSNLGSTGLDNVHFIQSAVPEPASLAMMSLGVAGLLLATRRRRQA